MLREYYKLAKPGIVYGNSIAAAAGFLLASIHGFNALLFTVTIFGIALLMASACVFNNYTDRNIDAAMTRTAKRALVTGVISTRSALFFATTLLILGFAILAVSTNLLTVIIGVIAFIDYVILYAVAKRKTSFGTAVGTVSGALPPVAGYIAVTGSLDLGAVCIFLVMVFWQMAHFYAIAVLRQTDYVAAHIPVYPVRHGFAATKRQIVIYITLFIVSVIVMLLLGYGSYVIAIALLFVAIRWLYLSLSQATDNHTVWARQVFKWSLYALLAFCATIAATPFLF